MGFSILNQDKRYLDAINEQGFVSYKNWEKVSYEQYRAM